MAGLSGIVKKISDLVTGTPADDDCFVFGKSDLKKITLAKLKDALGITSINSSLETKQDEFYTSVAPLNKVPFAIQKNMVLISNQIDGANNKSGYFSITDDNRSEWIGLSGIMPQSGDFIGFREVFVKTGTSGSEHIMAKITEMHPLCGRQYFNFYNHGTWQGWKSITPE